MRQKTPTRSELDPALCWDLAPLYASCEDWEKDFRRLDSVLASFQRWRGRLGE